MARRPASTPSLDASTRVAVLHGKDAYLRSRHTAELRAALEAEHEDLDVLSFDGLSAQPADVLDECRSFGLMARHKLVVVDNADSFIKESARPLLERYCQAPSDSATLVLRSDRWNKGKIDDRIGQIGAIIKCEAFSPAEAVGFVGAQAKEHGASIEPATAAMLVERVGTDAGRLSGEVAKLAIAAGCWDVSGASGNAKGAKEAKAGKGSKGSKAGAGGTGVQTPTIAAAHIDELVGQTREDEAWGLQDVLIEGRPEPILASLRRVLDNAPRETGVLVTIVMIDLARKMHALGQAMAAGENPRSVTGKLRIWPFERAGAMVERARRSSPDRLRDLVHAAIEADLRQKSGLGRSHRTIERLALKFAAV
ncbi:MAG: hypothetical protein R3B68_15570 [Phycisphaerales bacterium]